MENVENLISRIFGIAKTDILSQKDYERSINVLGNYNFWEELYDITYGYHWESYPLDIAREEFERGTTPITVKRKRESFVWLERHGLFWKLWGDTLIIADKLPEISSETLKDFIKNAKYTVVFPLLAGTWQTANLISSGSICTCHSMCYNYYTNNINSK